MSLVLGFILRLVFKRIYEDSVTGRLSAQRYDKLAADYETEQKELRMKIGELQYLIENEEQEISDLNMFLKNVRKYTDSEELTAEIYYKAVGIVEIPDLEECIVVKMSQKDSEMTA